MAAKQRKYFYEPPTITPNDPSSPTYVLDKQALDLPKEAQSSLRSNGYFVSVTGALFTHRDPRIKPAPVWIRLLSPAQSVVYITQLLYLFLRLRLNFFPCVVILFLALDTVLQKCINLDGEHCGNLSTLASLLLLCCMASDHCSFLASSLDTDFIIDTPLVLSSAAAASISPTSTTTISWMVQLFPISEWSKLIVWPIGATIGLLVLHVVFVRCSSFAWIAGWTLIGMFVIINVIWHHGNQIEVYGTLAIAAVLSTMMNGNKSGGGAD